MVVPDRASSCIGDETRSPGGRYSCADRSGHPGHSRAEVKTGNERFDGKIAK